MRDWSIKKYCFDKTYRGGLKTSILICRFSCRCSGKKPSLLLRATASSCGSNRSRTCDPSGCNRNALNRYSIVKWTTKYFFIFEQRPLQFHIVTASFSCGSNRSRTCDPSGWKPECSKPNQYNINEKSHRYFFVRRLHLRGSNRSRTCDPSGCNRNALNQINTT